MKISIFFLFISFSVASANDTIRIIASDSIPPYVMSQDKLDSDLPGLQIEIINSIFNLLGQKTSWKLMPNNRMIVQYKSKKVDAALNLPFMNATHTGYASDPIVEYKNCVIGSSSIQKTWEKELKELKILGHQRADIIYRDVFTDYDFKSDKYNEVTSQKTLAYHLINNRTDIVLSDYLVFSYFAKTFFENQLRKKDLVCLKEIKSPRSISLKSKALRDSFNKGLEKIKADGTYKKIITKYYKRFTAIEPQSSQEVRAKFIFAQN